MLDGSSSGPWSKSTRPLRRSAPQQTVSATERFGDPDAAIIGVMLRSSAALLWIFSSVLSIAATASVSGAETCRLLVDASAYNSVRAQTNSNPNLTAWGDRLEPGMKVIAVSRDLIALGLGHRAEVRIEGLPGTYRVLDKMAARWKKKIDVYFGRDVGAARKWGVRKVEISWSRPEGDAKRCP